jgi:hypothetical protein
MRRALALLTAMAVLAVPLAAGAQPTTGIGTAETALTLADLALDGLPEVVADGLDLGALRSFASTDADAVAAAAAVGDLLEGATAPVALANVALPLVGPALTARSGGPVALPAGLGSLTAGSLSATVVDDVASSSIQALSGSVNGLVGGLSVALPEGAGSSAVVSTTQALGANGAVLSGLNLGLTDVIPAELLAQLPLEVLLGLVGALPLDLGDLDLVGLTDEVLALLDDLLAAVTELAALDPQVLTELAAVEGALDPLLALLADARADEAAALLDVEAATALLEGLTGQLDTATADLAAATTLLATRTGELLAVGSLLGDSVALIRTACATLGPLCPTDVVDALGALDEAQAAVDLLTGTVAAVTAQVADATAGLADATAVLADVRDAIADLVAQIETLLDPIVALLQPILDRIDDLLADLTGELGVLDLEALIAQLLEVLGGVELLAVDEVAVGVTSLARADSSTATAACAVDGVRLLGEALDGVDTCAALEGVLGDLEGVVADLLGPLLGVGLPDLGLPVGAVGARSVPSLDEVITVGGLATSTTPDNHLVDGYQHAAASITALELGVASIPLVPLAGDLVGSITGDLAGVLDTLTGLTGLDGLAELVGVLDGLDLGAAPELGVLALDGVDLDALTGQLDGLLAELGDLPTGGALEGLATPGLGLRALGLDTVSTFQAAGGGDPDPVVPTDPTDPGTTPPGTTPPGTTPPGADPSPTPGTTPPGTSPTPTTGATPAPVVPVGNLPRTGGGMAGMALALLGLGGATAWTVRGRRD